MKKLSLKWKLTIVYTACMLCVMSLLFGILLSISSREVLASTQMQLKERVQESVEEIRYQNQKLSPTSDFYQMEDQIYLSLYDAEGYFLYGKIPNDFANTVQFQNGEVQTFRKDREKWFVYDLCLQYERQTVYLRGVTSATDAEESFAVTIRIALISLPLVAMLLGVFVYYFTRQTLLPVKAITNTVKKIRKDSDLTRRVALHTKQEDEIVALAQTFDEMLSELEKTFEREKQFTSDVSHELRTPISVILAQCEACLSKEEYSDAQKEDVRMIYGKARQMADMIAKLLLLSRADQGRQTIQKENVDVSELLAFIVEEQELLVKEKGMQLRCEIEPGITAMLDTTFYIQMMNNLFSNAVSYGKCGGVIAVHLYKEGDWLFGNVYNEGVGIAKDALPHIWKRFYREDRSRTDGTHSGLGLALVRWIVEAHGGTIAVESEQGAWTKFSYKIPLF